jgi:hypothetical protein
MYEQLNKWPNFIFPLSLCNTNSPVVFLIFITRVQGFEIPSLKTISGGAKRYLFKFDDTFRQ